MSPVDPENIRLTIAKQGTAEQSVALLLRAFCTAVHNAVEQPDPEHLVQIARHIDDNPKTWIDAVFANTPMAEQTRGIELVSLPTDVRDAFAAHGHFEESSRKRQNGDDQRKDMQPPPASRPGPSEQHKR